MAGRNPSYTRSLTDKFVIKGELSEDGTVINYIDSDKNEAVIEVEKCLKPFMGENIELSISIKMNQDLGGEDGDYE